VYLNRAKEKDLQNNSTTESQAVYTDGQIRRLNSPKQTKASRHNGSKSIGPKSQAGKKKAAQNAIQAGLFSRQVVIEQLGEKHAKFERIQNLVREVLRPSNTVEEILVADFTENWWRRERIRRAETSELKNRLAWLDMRNDLRRDDEVEALRSRFFVLFGMYLKAFRARSLEAVGEITREFQEVRQQLTSTTLGIDFLLGLLQYLSGEAKNKGVLSDQNEIMLKACYGFGSQDTDICLKFSLINRRESQNWATKDSEQSASGDGEVSSEQKRPGDNPTDKQAKMQEDEPVLSKPEYCALLASVIDNAATNLRMRRIKFELIEAAEARRASSLASSDPSSSDRFSRAETAVERRMYRALAFLTTMRAQGISNLLPEPGLKIQK
jgi:hypothetical protein